MGKGLRVSDVNDLPVQCRQQAREKLGALQPTGFEHANLVELARANKPRSEHDEQVDFFERIDELAELDPRYAIAARRTFAIPNGGFRDARTAGRLKAEGVKSGVADMQCAMPSAGAHALFVEMKRDANVYPTPKQREFIDESIRLGYVAVCCRGADEAFTVWKAYVEGTFE